MKKFVGYVNGESFDNEKDFNEAANKAIETNDGTLSISSYYSYSDDEGELKPDDHFLDKDEYVIGNRKADKVSGDVYEYTISEELTKKLKEASNKDDIRKQVESFITTFNNAKDERSKKIKSLQFQIENLQDELYETEEFIKDLKGRIVYYNTILDIIKEDKVEEEKIEPANKEKIKNILGINADMSLSTFLKQLGLL